MRVPAAPTVPKGVLAAPTPMRVPTVLMVAPRSRTRNCAKRRPHATGPREAYALKRLAEMTAKLAGWLRRASRSRLKGRRKPELASQLRFLLRTPADALMPVERT